MERPAWAPAELDLDRSNAARMYDCFGGWHTFAVDREVAVQAIDARADRPGPASGTAPTVAGSDLVR
jgi:S-adenosyl methyltransferase